MRSQGVAFGVLMALACVRASAQLTYLSQARAVGAGLNYGGSGGQQATDFGPFHGVAYAAPGMYGVLPAPPKTRRSSRGRSPSPAASRPRSRRRRERGLPVPALA